jgi:hypothetical protein|tara:strand:+ start:545 stop:1237 length:693 start_codon:yes stop_codon:yes gene_type:complete
MINKILKLTLIVGFALGLLTKPIMAMTAKLGIGLYGTTMTLNTDGSETETTGNKETASTSVDKTVGFGSVFTEVMFKSDSGFGTAINFEYIPGSFELGNKSRLDSVGGSPSDGNGTRIAKAKVSGIATLSLEPTFYVNDMWGIFLKAGVNRLKVTTQETLPESNYGNKDILGGVIGLGVRRDSPNGLFMKVEASMTNYDEMTFNGTNGNLNQVKADLDSEALRFAIGYSF